MRVLASEAIRLTPGLKREARALAVAVRLARFRSAEQGRAERARRARLKVGRLAQAQPERTQVAPGLARLLV